MPQRIFGVLFCALLYTGCVDASAADERNFAPARQILNVVRVFMNYVDEDEFQYTFLTEKRFAGDALLWRHHYYRLRGGGCGNLGRWSEVVFYPDVPRSSKYLWVDVHLCDHYTGSSTSDDYSNENHIYKLGIHVRSPEDVSGGGWDTGGKHPIRNQTNVVQ